MSAAGDVLTGDYLSLGGYDDGNVAGRALVRPAAVFTQSSAARVSLVGRRPDAFRSGSRAQRASRAPATAKGIGSLLTTALPNGHGAGSRTAAPWEDVEGNATEKESGPRD